MFPDFAKCPLARDGGAKSPCLRTTGKEGDTGLRKDIFCLVWRERIVLEKKEEWRNRMSQGKRWSDVCGEWRRGKPASRERVMDCALNLVALLNPGRC